MLYGTRHKMAGKLRPESLLNNVPIELILASLRESLFKKLFEWARLQKDGKEKSICARQINWINLPEKLAFPNVKAIISLIELFLQLDQDNGILNGWYFEQMFKFWTSLEYPRRLALLLAARTGHLELVQETVMYMTSRELIMTQDMFQSTALHWAADRGHLEIVVVLVDMLPHKAWNFFVKVKDHRSRTALYRAINNGHLEVVQVLVDRMSQETLNAKDRMNGRTALHQAVHKGHRKIVQVLVDRISLHYAIEIGHLGMVEALVDNMPQKKLLANDHQNLRKALQVAQELKQTSIVEYLSTKYPNLESRN